MDLEAAFDAYGLLAIALIMLVKSVGVPVPVPADLLMLFTAARAAEGRLSLWQAFMAILLALVVGGAIQFLLARGPGRALLYRYGRYLGLPPARLDRASGALKRGGPLGIAVAILTPGVRVAAVAACGLADLSLSGFLPGLTLGSAAFAAVHFGLGYAGAWLLAAVLALPFPLAVAIVVAVLATGLAVWWVIRRRQRPTASRLEITGDAFEAWHEAACPACLALGAIARAETLTGRPVARAPLAAGD